MKDEMTKVLVVEDEAVWRELIFNILSSSFSVEVTASYGEALAKLINYPYEILVIDPSLPSSPEPNFDGLHLLDDPKVNIKSMPIVIVTGNDSPQRTDAIFSQYRILAYFSKKDFDNARFLKSLATIKKETGFETKRRETSKQPSLWLNGLFIIILLITIFILIGWLAKSVSPIVFTIAIAGSILLLLITSLLVFRRTRDINDKEFNRLLKQIIQSFSDIFKNRK